MVEYNAAHRYPVPLSLLEHGVSSSTSDTGVLYSVTAVNRDDGHHFLQKLDIQHVSTTFLPTCCSGGGTHVERNPPLAWILE